MIFVNSLRDLFHKDVDRAFVDKVFDAMEQADWHVDRCKQSAVC
jgi:protein gp37